MALAITAKATAYAIPALVGAKYPRVFWDLHTHLSGYSSLLGFNFLQGGF